MNFEKFAVDLHLAKQKAGIWQKIPVIVPSIAMGDYIAIRLANKFGITSNLEFNFLGSFEWKIIEKIANFPSLSKSAITWQIFSHISKNLNSIFENNDNHLSNLLKNIIKTTKNPNKFSYIWQYSEQVAEQFSTYINNRANWLEIFNNCDKDLSLKDLFPKKEFNQQTQNHYQKILNQQQYLWQKLFKNNYQKREQIKEKALNQIDKQKLPSSVFIFAPNHLSIQQIKTIKKIADQTEVFLYLNFPSAGYLPDLADHNWVQKQSQDQHYQDGNYLLSLWGKEARELSRILKSADLYEQPDLHKKDRTTILNNLQMDIAELNDLTPFNPKAGDNSLQLHVCSSLTHQLEVLRAELVQWLNQDKNRQLSDILIICPQLDQNLDLFSALFPINGGFDGYQIPAKITGISNETTALWQSVTGFFQIYFQGINQDNLKNWLLQEETCKRFKINPSIMEKTLDNLIDAGFRYGFDQKDLQNQQINDQDNRYSFSYALNRLVISHLMPEAKLYSYDQQKSFMSIDYFANELLEGLAVLCQIAKEWQYLRAKDHEKLDTYFYLDFLKDYLQKNYSFASQENSYQTIEQSIQELQKNLNKNCDFGDDVLQLSFIIKYLGNQLQDRYSASEPSGVITIARPNALRQIPYKLIAVVGVDYGLFPNPHQNSINSLLKLDEHKLGDYRRDWEELGSLLDAINSAEQNFWLFYNKTNQSNEELPIATPIKNLITHLNNYNINEKFFIKEHNPTPFNKQDPIKAPLWQEISQQNNQSIKPFLTNQKEYFDKKTRIDIAKLAIDLLNPIKAFLREQQIANYKNDFKNNPLELISPNNLQQYLNEKYIVEQKPINDLDYLPFSPVGIWHKVAIEKIKKTQEKRKTHLNQISATTNQTITIQQYQVTGSLPKNTNHWIMASAKKGDKIKHKFSYFLQHLFWCCTDDNKKITTIYFRESKKDKKIKKITFKHIDPKTAKQELTKWIDHYQKSLVIPLFAPLELLADKNPNINNWWKEDNFNRIESRQDWLIICPDEDILLNKINENINKNNILEIYANTIDDN